MNFLERLRAEIQIKKEISYYELVRLCRVSRKKVSYAERLLRKMRNKEDDYFFPKLEAEKQNGAIIKYYLK